MMMTYRELAEDFARLGIPDFSTMLTDANLMRSLEHLDTMQVNVGYACNFACEHCFLDSSPARTEMMQRQTMADCLAVFAQNGFRTLDITGGAPDLNPNLEWFVDAAAQLGQIIVRSNAALLVEPDYQHLVDVFVRNKATVIVSLPCYTRDNVDSQRGAGNFALVIAGLQALNAVGYGSNPELQLNLAYNPLGAYLPGPQCGLEADYKRELGNKQGIVFDNLYCMANTPMGRFGKSLLSKGEYDDYLTLIYKSFNAQTLTQMMCRNQLNVDYDGRLYDCEMNHVIQLPLAGSYQTISELRGQKLAQRPIGFSGACYVCTAGSGSSCGGSLV